MRARKRANSNEHENQLIMGAVDQPVGIHPIHVYKHTFITEGSVYSAKIYLSDTRTVRVIVGISGGCASVCNAPLSPESRYIPYFLLFSFILRAVGPILSYSLFIL